MKRFFLFALVATVFAACSTDTTQDLAPEIPTAPDELQVSFDEEDTRIQLGENGAPVWTEGDLVSVFYKSDGNDCYKFTGNTGDREGMLKRTSVGEWSRRGDNVVVVYPYSKSYIISLSANTVEASLPAEQTYAKNSYGIGSSLMIATGDYKQFALKNVCGWLKLQFTGSGSISKIVLRGNDGEQVAGNMLVCADDASCILAEASADIDDDEVGGALITDGDILTSVTLNCGDGVALNSETPTAFYIALPPQIFEKGFTLEITDNTDFTMSQSTEKMVVIERNHILPMATLLFVNPNTPATPNPATNEIWYTATAKVELQQLDATIFGANAISNVFDNDTKKGIITFDGDVTMIGEKAFYACDALTSVTIPDSVTTIGERAFEDCDALTSVTIPDSVTTIGGYAFCNCYALTSVTIPNSVTTIGSFAFASCDALTSVTIPDSVTTIGEYAFQDCDALTSVTIGDSVTEIGCSAFYACDALKAFYGKFASADNRCLIVDGVLNSFAPAGLTEYTIPDSVTKIGDYAFRDCRALTSVTIPDSVTTIGEYAFQDCDALKDVYCHSTTPPTANRIGSNWSAFNGNASGRRIYVPIASVDAYKAANGWSDYADAIIAFSNNQIWYTSSDGNVVTPYKTDVFGANITSNTYENGVGVITFDGDVTTIGYRAFYNCDALTSVTIPDSVTTIGERAFYNCDALKAFYGKFASADNRCLIVDGVLNSFAPAGLTTYSIPNSVTVIGEYAFRDCDALTNVTIPDSVTTIGKSAFWGCDALTSVTIPDSVTTIGYGAFYNCSALKSVTIGNRVTTIGGYAFYNCDALTSVTIPDSVTTIGDWAFESCDALTSVTIGNSVTTIGSSAFQNCFALKEVYCKPTTPPSLSLYVFNNNASNRIIYVPMASVDAYKAALLWSEYADAIIAFPNNQIWYTSSDGNVVEPYATDVFGANIISNTYKNGVGVITFDGDVTTIGVQAFYNRDVLTSVTIPDSVTTIGDSAFRDCNALTSVTILDSVTTIGGYAFYDCSALKEVYCKPTNPPSLGSSVFYGNASGRRFYVPTASVDAYKAADGWSDYADAIIAFPNNQIWYTSSDGNVVEPYATDVFGANITSNTYENGVGLITFDGDLTTIGDSAFRDCNALKSITIPDSVTTIGNMAFIDCSALTSVTIPDSVTTIGDGVFGYCSSLTSVTIPDSVMKIGDSAFRDCNALTSVTIPDSVTTIGDSAFYGCDALKSVTIGNSVTTIGIYAFRDCSALKSVTIGNSVTTIGSGAFASCYALKAFYGKFASADNRCLIADGVLNSFAPAGLTTYSIPNSVTTIGNYAFLSCSALTSVTIPDSVTTIGNSAFYDCSALTSVTIPDSVTTIGSGAFSYCSALKEVYCKPTTPPSLGYRFVFDYNASVRIIYVPTASVDAYKAKQYWSEYADAIYPYTFTE